MMASDGLQEREVVTQTSEDFGEEVSRIDKDKTEKRGSTGEMIVR